MPFLVFVIFVSAAIFIYAAFLFEKTYNLSDNAHIQKNWIILVFFIIFFIFGYLLFGIIISTGTKIVIPEFLISSVFFVGSLFTVMSARMFFKIVLNLNAKSEKLHQSKNELKKYSRKLEKMVKDRTLKLEEAHQKHLKKTEEIQKLKDQFIYVAAHELRSPVTALKWNLEMIRNSKLLTNKNAKEDVELINNMEESNNHLIELVNDLLDISRIEYKTLKIIKEKCDIHKLITETLRPFIYTGKKHHVKIVYKKPSQKIPAIKTDSKRVKEILINLISNAIKYNYKNGEVTIKPYINDNLLRIEIIDTGMGIEKKDQIKLFKKFSRIITDETKEIGGTGLGLFIVKELVEKLKGDIKVESEGKGKGSKFTVSLPLK